MITKFKKRCNVQMFWQRKHSHRPNTKYICIELECILFNLQLIEKNVYIKTFFDLILVMPLSSLFSSCLSSLTVRALKESPIKCLTRLLQHMRVAYSTPPFIFLSFLAKYIIFFFFNILFPSFLSFSFSFWFRP